MEYTRAVPYFLSIRRSRLAPYGEFVIHIGRMNYEQETLMNDLLPYHMKKKQKCEGKSRKSPKPAQYCYKIERRQKKELIK